MSKFWEPVELISNGKHAKIETKTFAPKAKSKSAVWDIQMPQSLEYKELKAEGDALYANRVAEEEKLIGLYKEKKLTNKDTIRRVRAILKSRKPKEEKEQKASSNGDNSNH